MQLMGDGVGDGDLGALVIAKQEKKDSESATHQRQRMEEMTALAQI